MKDPGRTSLIIYGKSKARGAIIVYARTSCLCSLYVLCMVATVVYAIIHMGDLTLCNEQCQGHCTSCCCHYRKEQEQKHNPERVWHYWYPPVVQASLSENHCSWLHHSKRGQQASTSFRSSVMGQRYSFTRLYHNPPCVWLQVLIEWIYIDLDTVLDTLCNLKSCSDGMVGKYSDISKG